MPHRSRTTDVQPAGRPPGHFAYDLGGDQGSVGVEDADGLEDEDSVVSFELTLEDAGGGVRDRLVTSGQGQCNGTEEPRRLLLYLKSFTKFRVFCNFCCQCCQY